MRAEMVVLPTPPLPTIPSFMRLSPFLSGRSHLRAPWRCTPFQRRCPGGDSNETPREKRGEDMSVTPPRSENPMLPDEEPTRPDAVTGAEPMPQELQQHMD